ncbi:response regulator, partial [Bradyrhizobium sp.]
TTGLEALTLVRSKRPDILIADIGMPKLSGLLLARRLGDDCPETKVIVLTAHDDAAHVKQALAAGVRGYLVKRSAPDTLVPAIKAVLAGGTFVDPLVAGHLFPRRRSRQASIGGLSERECEVLKMCAAGHSTKEIAAQMMLGIKSVETYRSRAMGKLGLKSRAEIVGFGLAQGWLA